MRVHSEMLETKLDKAYHLIKDIRYTRSKENLAKYQTACGIIGWDIPIKVEDFKIADTVLFVEIHAKHIKIVMPTKLSESLLIEPSTTLLGKMNTTPYTKSLLIYGYSVNIRKIHIRSNPISTQIVGEILSVAKSMIIDYADMIPPTTSKLASAKYMMQTLHDGPITKHHILCNIAAKSRKVVAFLSIKIARCSYTAVHKQCMIQLELNDTTYARLRKICYRLYPKGNSRLARYMKRTSNKKQAPPISDTELQNIITAYKYLQSEGIGNRFMHDLETYNQLSGIYILTTLITYISPYSPYRSLNNGKQLYTNIVASTPKIIRKCKYILGTVLDLCISTRHDVPYSNIQNPGLEIINSIKHLPTTRFGWYMLCAAFLSTKSSIHDQTDNIVPVNSVASTYTNTEKCNTTENMSAWKIKTIENAAHTSIKAWHIFRDNVTKDKQTKWKKGERVETKRSAPYSIGRLLGMYEYIKDGAKMYKSDYNNEHGILFKKVDITKSILTAVRNAMFNHNQEKKIRIHKLLAKKNEFMCDPPVILPIELEVLRLRTHHDMCIAGIECDHCIGQYTNSKDMFFRREDICAQVDRHTFKVTQCYDVKDKITDKSNEFKSYITKILSPYTHRLESLNNMMYQPDTPETQRRIEIQRQQLLQADELVNQQPAALLPLIVALD